MKRTNFKPLMSRYGIIWVIICYGFTSSAYGQAKQQSVTGKLIDIETGEPVAFALIYVDGTTIGVTSNENGDFIFDNLTFPIQLEISHLNYNPKSILLNKPPLELETVSLEPRGNMLDEVVVMDRRLRDKLIKKFIKWFIGDDQWGKKAKLLNEDALLFFEEPYSLKVVATEPLIIESTLLGYTIHADLISFELSLAVNKKEEYSRYIASYHFNDLNNKKYKKNRLEAYYNSSEHFLKSLYENRLIHNGYIMAHENTDGSMGHENLIITKLDSFLIDGENNEKLIIGLKNELYYIYYYYNRDGSPVNLNFQIPSPPYYISTLAFEDDKIRFRANGTTPGSSMVFSGPMGNKKVGAMLPKNYLPKSTKEPTKY